MESRGDRSSVRRSQCVVFAGRDRRLYRGRWACDWTTKPGTEGPGAAICTHYSYSYATQLVILDEAGEVEKVVAAHDAGRIMNPTLFEGQIEGSIHMGLGYALTEDFVVKNDGHPASLMLRKCGILRAHRPGMHVSGGGKHDGRRRNANKISHFFLPVPTVGGRSAPA